MSTKALCTHMKESNMKNTLRPVVGLTLLAVVALGFVRHHSNEFGEVELTC